MEKIKKLLHSEEPLKWLFYGDSITHGSRHLFGYRDYTQLFAERVRYELKRMQDICINTATGGDSTTNLISGFEWRVKQFNPDIIFIMIGMNDCSDDRNISVVQFENKLLALLDMITEIDALPILQTSCTVISGNAGSREINIDKYMDAIRKVASDRQVSLIDHNKVWKENANMSYYWMANPFHPNEYGQRVFARNIFNSLGIFDPESTVCKLFIPENI